MIKYYLNRETDIKQICDLRQSVGWNRMEKSSNNPNLQHFLSINAYDDRRLVGYVDVVSNGVTDAYIQDLMVRPDMQNKGIGTTLMNMAIDEINKKGIYMVSVIYGDAKLKKFYEKFGFYTVLCGQMQLRDED